MKKALILSAALLALTACSVKDAVQVPDSPLAIPMGCEITLTARCAAPDGDSKTVRQPDGKVYWSPEEKIYVDNYTSDYFSNYYLNLGYCTFTSTNTEPSPTASFTGSFYDFSEGGTSTDYYAHPMNVLVARFPVAWSETWYNNGWVTSSGGFQQGLGCNEWAQDQYGENAWPPVQLYTTCTIPQIQHAVAGTFDRNLLPSIALSRSTDLVFHHYGGGVKFSLTGDNIVSVNLLSGDNTYINLSRAFYIDYQSLSVDDRAGWMYSSRMVTLNTTDGEPLVPGVDYYFVTFPCDFPNGIVLEMNTNDGEVLKRVITKPLEIKKGHFLVLNNVDAGLSGDNPVGSGGIDDFTFDPII